MEYYMETTEMQYAVCSCKDNTETKEYKDISLLGQKKKIRIFSF
jgi:hypothetical protein